MESNVHLTSNLALWILTWIISALIVFEFIKCIKSRHSDSSKGMCVNYTTMMKGIATFIILMHHFVIHISNIGGPMKVYGFLGFYGVAIFLSISGYVETNLLYERGDRYYDGYLRKKIMRIYIPWLITTILFAVMYQISNTQKLLKSLFVFQTLYRTDTYNWFVIYILYEYFVLYLWKTIKNRLKNQSRGGYLLYQFITSLIWIAFCLATNRSWNWYINSFSFLFGSICYCYKDRINEKNCLMSMILCGVCTIIPILFSFIIEYEALKVLLYFICSIFVCFFVFMLSKWINHYSKPLIALGRCSLEVFLVGTGAFLWAYNVVGITNTWHSLLVVFVGIIIISWSIYVLSTFINKKIVGYTNK